MYRVASSERRPRRGVEKAKLILKIANHLASVIARFSAVAKLEETIRYNELFAGVIAHDLRNPLGAMMTAAQLLLMRREGEAARSSRDQALEPNRHEWAAHDHDD